MAPPTTTSRWIELRQRDMPGIDLAVGNQFIVPGVTEKTTVKLDTRNL
jgi:hypothetical protein